MGDRSLELSFGSKLELARTETGLQPAEFARLIGVSRQLYAQWTKKKRCSIGAQNLRKLADATGKDESYWTGKPVRGVALVDEVEDSAADLEASDTTSGGAMRNPIAQTALTLLMKLSPEQALEVIEEAATRLSAMQKEPRRNPR